MGVYNTMELDDMQTVWTFMVSMSIFTVMMNRVRRRRLLQKVRTVMCHIRTIDTV